MRYLFLILFILSSNVLISAQAAKTETSDPKAKVILDKVKKIYDGYSGWETNFELGIKLAEQKKESVQKGKFYQSGEKFRVEMGNQLIFSDGALVYQKSDNVVRIMKPSKNSTQMLSPRDFIRMYEKKEFTYAIVGDVPEGWSKKATQIVFKPNNRRSEYTQMKMFIDQKTNYIVSIQAFGRDASRYALRMESPSVNKTYASSQFTFDAAKFPNVKVEDMRDE